jgi:hypothetical protein
MENPKPTKLLGAAHHLPIDLALGPVVVSYVDQRKALSILLIYFRVSGGMLRGG